MNRRHGSTRRQPSAFTLRKLIDVRCQCAPWGRVLWRWVGTSVLLGTVGMSTAFAQSVVLAGVLGKKALIVLDGGTPRALAAGETHEGVTVLEVGPTEAMIRIGNEQRKLRLGEAPARVAGSGASRRTVVLKADHRGHFINSGTINGRVMQYMIDTGASAVAIGRNDADRLGIAYTQGQPVRINTANGVAQGWRVKLDSVRLGDVEVYGIEAVVTPQAMPYVLMGNSLLMEFQMTRQNDVMVLEKR